MRLVLAALLIALPSIAVAQMDSREGIALQNQILQLRQEVEILRRGGLSAPQPATGGVLSAPMPSRPAGAQGDLVPALLDRVQRLEEELRSVRGRAEEAEFRERQLRERVEKLEGDIDFRLQQLEGQRRGAAPAASPPAAAAGGAATGAGSAAAAPAAPAAAAAGRTPQRALAEGQAALGRRNFTAAEAAAREVIGSRDTTRIADAQILLGDALLGKRDFAGAAVAYDDARRRNPRGSRAPEATVGIADALIGLNNNRDACTLLNELRSSNPNLSGPVAERAANARRRASCR
jgi:TolA-binding protein